MHLANQQQELQLTAMLINNVGYFGDKTRMNEVECKIVSLPKTLKHFYNFSTDQEKSSVMVCHSTTLYPVHSYFVAPLERTTDVITGNTNTKRLDAQKQGLL